MIPLLSCSLPPVPFQFRKQLLHGGGDGSRGAAHPAFPAADAFHAVGILPGPDIHGAELPASSAADTFILRHLKAVEGYLVEKPVKGSQGAKVFAEGPLELYGQDQHQKH